MGGKMSRDKGSRVERALRDVFRSQGFQSDRVPLSGASQGYKGDVRFTKDDKVYHAEVKARKDSFKNVYGLWSENVLTNDTTTLRYVHGDSLVIISNDVREVLKDGGMFPLSKYLPGYGLFFRTFGKIENMKKLLGGCDVLAIKNDRHPFLFIRYKSR